MAVMDILVRATDQASAVLEGIGKRGSEAGGWLEQNWLKVGAATAAAGVAIEKFARQQAPLTENTRKLAASINITEAEMRELVLSTSNVTRPVGEVIALFEVGRQQGIRTAEGLSEFAAVWDTVGDATGESSTMLAEASIGLRALGIESGNQQDAMAALGFVLENTSLSAGDFLQFIQLTGPELRDMSMDIDDTAAILGVLEGELGLTGRRLRTEFREAVRNSNGDVEEMYKLLGITGDQVDTYRGKVAESSNIIERNAQIHEDSYTSLQKMQYWATELTYSYGDLIGVAGNFAPVLMAMGPLMKGVAAAKGLMAKATLTGLIPAMKGAIASTWSFTAALLANPITWVVAGIAALIAAIYLLWKNWDTVSQFLSNSWEWIKEKAGALITGVTEWFSQLPDRLREHLTAAIARAREWVEETVASAKEAGARFMASFMEFLAELPYTLGFLLGRAIAVTIAWAVETKDKAIEAGRDLLARFIEFVVQLPGKLWEALTLAIARIGTWQEDVRRRATEAGQNLLARFIEFATQLPGQLLNHLTTGIARIKTWSTDVSTNAKEAGRNFLNGFMDTITGLPGKVWDTLLEAARKLLSIGTTLWNNAKTAGSKIWSGFKAGLGISSPSYLERAMDDILAKSHQMEREVRADFGALKELQVPDAGSAASAWGTAGEKTEVRIVHSFENLPDEINEEKLAVALVEALKNTPELQRLLDRITYIDTKRRRFPIGEAI